MSLTLQSAAAAQLAYAAGQHYDWQAGPSTQPDPIGLAGGLNLYGYAGGDPINFSDPFGLAPEWWNKLVRGAQSARRVLNIVGIIWGEMTGSGPFDDKLDIEEGLPKPPAIEAPVPPAPPEPTKVRPALPQPDKKPLPFSWPRMQLPMPAPLPLPMPMPGPIPLPLPIPIPVIPPEELQVI